MAAAVDVLEGLVNRVGDARLVDGSHDVGGPAGWPFECPLAAGRHSSALTISSFTLSYKLGFYA
jgi:hypothetical protein